MKINPFLKAQIVKVVGLLGVLSVCMGQSVAHGEMKSPELRPIAFATVDVLRARIESYPMPPLPAGQLPVAGVAYPMTWKIGIPARFEPNSLSTACMFYAGHHVDSSAITLKYVPSYLSQLPVTIKAKSFRGEGIKANEVNPTSAYCPPSLPETVLPLTLTTHVVLRPLPGTYLLPPAPVREFIKANGKLYMIEVGLGTMFRVIELPQQ